MSRAWPASLPQAENRGVTVLIEALPKAQCDVVLTLDEAAGLVREIDSPAIRTMFDVHNAIDETEPHAVLVERYFDLIRHVHVNELDGRHCGWGNYDFKPVLDTLRRLDYEGWVSLEAFDFTPGAEKLANESLRHLESEIAQPAIMSKYVVTGGAGFIGSAIVRGLAARGRGESHGHRQSADRPRREPGRGAAVRRLPARRHPQLRRDRADHPRRRRGLPRSRHPLRPALDRRSGAVARNQHRRHLQRAARRARRQGAAAWCMPPRRPPTATRRSCPKWRR